MKWKISEKIFIQLYCSELSEIRLKYLQHQLLTWYMNVYVGRPMAKPLCFITETPSDKITKCMSVIAAVFIFAEN